MAGQVLNYYTCWAGATKWHPDKLYLLPSLLSVQHIIYKVGTQYLPEDDAEKAYWAQQWFIYPYSKHIRAASRDAVNRIYPEKVFLTVEGEHLSMKDALDLQVELQPKPSRFTDLAWYCLEIMATKEFGDRQMYRAYLRNYAGMGHFYAHYAILAYTKISLNSRRIYIKMPALIKRDQELLKWLHELKDKWSRTPEMISFAESTPKVEAMREMAVILLLHNTIPATIWTGEFSCESSYLKDLEKVRREFVYTREGIQPPLGRMKEKSTARQFYFIAIDSAIARFLSFITEENCGYRLPGKEDMQEFNGAAISPLDRRRRTMRALFTRELKLLGMDNVLTEKYWTHIGDGKYEWR
ncbi:hypothetical protein [Desulfopila sp. IMCC35008]|uniref:hypothetical protein n=1 Tax=Desulfopila sp. IMCC35008 TaxID=2653858 RepID=UPI0013D07312|nr:hypothetical protein [Desulfopila sp. IMCC35008]